MNSPLDNPSPQFGTAEYVGAPGGDHCNFCHQPIAATYYRIKNVMTCPNCAEKIQSTVAPDSHAAFVRAILFGVGAAILGMALYATFEITTGIIIGYAALAVGWIVGKAMITGSKGVGGRRYQIAAVLLTYAAVATAAIPVWIHYAGEHKQSRQTQKQTTQSPDSPPPQGSDAEEPQTSAPRERPTFAAAIGKLLFLGLASPFYELADDPVGGGIGLVILFVGMRFAWQFTAARAPQILGPFENSPPLAR